MSFLTLCQMTKPLTSTTLKTSNRTKQVVFHIMEFVIDKADKKKRGKEKKDDYKTKDYQAWKEIIFFHRPGYYLKIMDFTLGLYGNLHE